MEDNQLNQPAFPIRGGMNEHQFGGLSMRDFFAVHRPAPNDIGRAWGEACVREYPKLDGLDMPFGREVAQWWADVEAAWSYMQADAMLRARAA